MFFKRTAFILLFTLICVIPAFSNGISLNNIGPKSLGMGGAFVAVADDYSAIYWNPAGISQLEGSQIAVFVTDVIPSGTYKLAMPNGQGGFVNVDAKMDTKHYISPNLMGYLQLLKGDLSVGIGMYVPSGLGSSWEGKDLEILSGGQSYEWMGKIGVFTFSPVASYKINKMLSVGATLNINYGMFDMKRPEAIGNNQYVQYEESGTGLGYGASLGLLVKPLDFLKIGLSAKLKSTISYKGTAKNQAFQALGHYESDYTRDMALPLWIGGGIALEPLKNLTIALDAHFSQWSKSENEIITTYKDPLWDVMVNQTGKNKIEMKWKDEVQFRFGAQYQLLKELFIRAGYYYDPAPAPDETMNIIFPSNTYNSLTFGLSYKFGVLNFDWGIEYMMGTDRTISLAFVSDPTHPQPDAMPGTHGMNILGTSLGISYTFK